MPVGRIPEFKTLDELKAALEEKDPTAQDFFQHEGRGLLEEANDELSD